MASGIGACDFKGSGREVGSVDFGGRQFFGEGESDAAGASSDVGDAQVRVGREFLCASPLNRNEVERRLNQVFGLRARNEDCRGDDEIHTPEFLVASDVLRGDSAGSLSESSFVPGLLIAGKLALRMRVEIRAVAVEREHEQGFGGQAWRGNIRSG